MPVSCDPQDLITASNQYCCISGTPELAEAVKIYLLARIAGLESMTPQELTDAATCYLSCIPSGAVKPVQAYLLCQAANAAGA